MMQIVGTAGHVDHGKSTLIAALTGTHPDRLKEEQEREMTIDLGFGWMTMPSGREIGIIDVPGHRDFIGNMLAGIGGIDLVMLVVAADEGVMPQTSEHLAIIDLLQIPKGIIVLSKIDMVDDAEWLAMVESDIRSAVKGTCLADASILRVSARNGNGLDALITHVDKTLQQLPARTDRGLPRLPIDRVFSMTGFGTVVTGTLLDGTFKVGDDIVVLPQGLHGKIRGLQTHKTKEEKATPGSRTAINIAGIHASEIDRGCVVAKDGQYSVTNRIDCSIRLLNEKGNTLKHNSSIKIFLGASEIVANCRVLNQEQLNPGEEGFIQLELAAPISAARGDRFILRRPSPAETIGGGILLDPQPKNRHKRNDTGIINRLGSLLNGDPSDLLLASLAVNKFQRISELISSVNLPEEVAKDALNACIKVGDIQILETNHSDGFLASNTTMAATISAITNTVLRYHQEYPYRRGIPKEELKTKVNLPAKVFQVMLDRAKLREDRNSLSADNFKIQYSSADQTRINHVLAQFTAAPFSPPFSKDTKNELGDEVYNSMLETGILIQVSPEVAFTTDTYQIMLQKLRDRFGANPFTAAEVRDIFNSSRKYVLALLEYWDNKGITRRIGDERVFR